MLLLLHGIVSPPCYRISEKGNILRFTALATLQGTAPCPVGSKPTVLLSYSSVMHGIVPYAVQERKKFLMGTVLFSPLYQRIGVEYCITAVMLYNQKTTSQCMFPIPSVLLSDQHRYVIAQYILLLLPQ